MLTGRVALITGANHGIGAATARHIAADGASVVVTYLRCAVDSDPGTPEAYQANRMRPGEEVVAEIERAGGRAIAVEADLLDRRRRHACSTPPRTPSGVSRSSSTTRPDGAAVTRSWAAVPTGPGAQRAA